MLMLSYIQNIDDVLLERIRNACTCPALDYIMPKISALGNGGFIWLMVALVLTLTKKYKGTGIALLLGLLAGVLIGNVILKNLFARPRPCWLDKSVELLIKMPIDYSFPSCHTLSSFIAATILILSERGFFWFALPLALLIAFSRIYLYVHFPTDVIAAVVLGALIGYCIFKSTPELILNITKRLNK